MEITVSAGKALIKLEQRYWKQKDSAYSFVLKHFQAKKMISVTGRRCPAGPGSRAVITQINTLHENSGGADLKHKQALEQNPTTLLIYSRLQVPSPETCTIEAGVKGPRCKQNR